MKKTILFFLIMVASAFLAGAQDCPFGETYDPYPGDCARYVDSDSSGFCDYSEPAGMAQVSPDVIELTGQEVKGMTVSEVARHYGIDEDVFLERISAYLEVDVKKTDAFQLLHDNYGSEPSIIKDIAISIREDKQIEFKKTVSERYVFLSLALVITGIYIISYVLAKRKKFPMQTHKKIWNILLMISFLVTALSGIYLVIRLNYGLIIEMPFNILYWHVEFGIVLAFIAMFHALWHTAYFLAMFRKDKN